MSKFGWSYPPGVSERNLPGNSPEEQAAEAFYDSVYTKLEEIKKGSLTRVAIGFDEVAIEELTGWIWKQVGEAYGRGYAEGVSDKAMAEEFNQE